MVNEVSKLIYNAIVRYHAVYLPDVGTISVVRRSATMRSKSEVIPPKFDIEYTLCNNAKSLIEIISTETGVDVKRAEEVYQRWLDNAREGSVVVIDRLGTLRGNSFVADSSLIAALNTNNQLIHIKPRRNFAPLYASLVIVIIGCLCAGGWWYFNTSSADEPAVIIAQEVAQPIVETPLVEVEEPVELEIVEDVEIVENIVADWRENSDIRHWVVVGSYSTTENAERAIADILKRLPDSQCNYFKLGSMYAVAAFGSVDIEECQQFKNAYYDDFPQSWVYTPKKFR